MQPDTSVPQRRLNRSQYIALCGLFFLVLQFMSFYAFFLQPLSPAGYVARMIQITCTALIFLVGWNKRRLNDMEKLSRRLRIMLLLSFAMPYLALSPSDPKPNRFGAPIKKTPPLYYCLWLTYPIIIFALVAPPTQLPSFLSDHSFTWQTWRTQHSSDFEITAPTSFTTAPIVKKDGIIVYRDDMDSATLAVIRMSNQTLSYAYGSKIAFYLDKLASWEQIKNQDGKKIFELANYDRDILIITPALYYTSGNSYLTDSIQISTDRVFNSHGDAVRELQGTYKVKYYDHNLKSAYKYFRLRFISHDNQLYILSVNHRFEMPQSYYGEPGTRRFNTFYNNLLKSRAFDNLYDRFFASFYPKAPAPAAPKMNHGSSKISTIKF